MRRLALLLLAGCSARAAAPKPADPTPPQVVEELDREVASAELRVAVLDSYRMLSAGYDSVYLETLARDERLVLFGVGPEDILVGFDPRAATLRAVISDEPYQLVSKQLEVGISTDGCCAWTEDRPSYRVVRDGRWAYFPLRSSGYFERRDGRWLKLLEHGSYPVPPEQLPGMTAPIAAAFPVVIPDGEAATRARDAVLALAQRGDAGLPGYTVEVSALRVQLSPTGTVVWAAALLKLRGEGVELDGRGTWVLEVEPGGEFRPVQSHVSVPVTDAAILEAAFGEGLRPSSPRSPR